MRQKKYVLTQSELERLATEIRDSVANLFMGRGWTGTAVEVSKLDIMSLIPLCVKSYEVQPKSESIYEYEEDE